MDGKKTTAPEKQLTHITVKIKKEMLQNLKSSRKLLQAKANLVRDGPNKLTPPPTTPEWVSRHLCKHISYIQIGEILQEFVWWLCPSALAGRYPLLFGLWYPGV